MGKRFRSKSDHTLDDKGRLIFPSRFRDVLRDYESDTLIIVPWFDRCLRIYPVEIWEQVEEKLTTYSGEDFKSVAVFKDFTCGNLEEVTMDRQGRILLSSNLRKSAGLEKDIALVGMIDRVHVWDLEVWERRNQAIFDNTESVERSLSQLGIN